MTDPKYKSTGAVDCRVIEECSELIMAICKANRFGLFSHHPDRPESSNWDEILREIDDVVESCEALEVWIRDLKYNFYSTKRVILIQDVKV